MKCWQHRSYTDLILNVSYQNINFSVLYNSPLYKADAIQHTKFSHYVGCRVAYHLTVYGSFGQQSSFLVSVVWIKRSVNLHLLFDVFSTVHHSIELFHQPTLKHNFLYSLTICLLHYYPRHVSSINVLIFRRKNCILTASDIFALCKRLHSTRNQCTVQTFTESEDNRCCVNTIFPPEDEHVIARNMLRIIV